MKRLLLTCVAAVLVAAPGSALAQSSGAPAAPATEALAVAQAPVAYPYPVAYPVYAYDAAYAAPPPPLAYSPSELPPDDEGSMEPKTAGRAGPKLKTVGIILTFAGAAVAAIGGGVLAAASSSSGGHDDLGYGQAGKQLGEAFGGAVLAVGGASVLVGIPLWAIGAAKSPPPSPGM